MPVVYGGETWTFNQKRTNKVLMQKCKILKIIYDECICLKDTRCGIHTTSRYPEKQIIISVQHEKNNTLVVNNGKARVGISCTLNVSNKVTKIYMQLK